MLAVEARMDMFDVIRADVVLVLNLAKSEGKAVEQGIALAREIPIIVVGLDRFNVFQYLPQYTFVKTVEEAIQLLKSEAVVS